MYKNDDSIVNIYHSQCNQCFSAFEHQATCQSLKSKSGFEIEILLRNQNDVAHFRISISKPSHGEKKKTSSQTERHRQSIHISKIEPGPSEITRASSERDKRNFTSVAGHSTVPPKQRGSMSRRLVSPIDYAISHGDFQTEQFPLLCLNNFRTFLRRVLASCKPASPHPPRPAKSPSSRQTRAGPRRTCARSA